MVTRIHNCDTNRLRRFLDDRLDEDDHDALADHLESCDSCRRGLDELAGEEIWWKEARAFLGPLEGADQTDENVTNPATSDHPGSLRTIGPYEVRGVIGRGGMGIVLKGFDPALNRFVAIKVLAPELATSGAARRRFAREAKAAAAVVHEHVIAIHSVDASGTLPYLVMPYVAGESLQERIDRVGPLEPIEVLRIGMQVADGLAAAHAQGLVHRDIKPANILLENGVERVKITDFGLARAFDAGLTQSGVIVGTPQYMAPEQANGDPVDHRADLFSLGSVLYAMSTGLAPFRAESPLAVLRRVVDENPRPVREINPDIPDWLDAIIARLQSKIPADRPATAEEVNQILGRQLAKLQQPGTSPAPRRLSRVALGVWLVPFAVLAVSAAGTPAIVATWRDVFAAAPAAMPSTPQTPEEPSLPGAHAHAEPIAVAVVDDDDDEEPAYDSFDEAKRAGQAYVQLKQFKKARKALETALKLAPTDDERIKVYHILLPAYRALPDVTKTFDALEFIIAHSESAPERSLARTSMLGAAFEREKVGVLTSRYEAKLKKQADDFAALYILSEAYDRLSPNPKRGAEIAKRLGELDKKAGRKVDFQEEARRASQLVKSGKIKEGAELFESVAQADPKLSAWNYKEAAVAWQKAKDQDRALKAARASLASTPEDRGALLEYFWRRSLGDVFLDADHPELAIPQYEAALTKTDIAGYLSETRQKLSDAKTLAAKPETTEDSQTKD
jgi:serine/threonine-protein kinase